MTRRKRFYRLVLCGSAALAALAGCQDHSHTSSAVVVPTLPTDPVSIVVGGQCHGSGSTIVCRDASRSEPQSRLTAVDWELISISTGLSQGVSPSAPGGEVSFTGLSFDTYQVNQTVSAQGGSTQERTYGPFIISP
ncbi:MAG TPA: hypothetical protein VGS07_07875 [Thermoanaerobaculia bacterium]|jgi:hypothetical protein|nr:hypothetical protein [Thermoanaerobaculia bacterium]